ncbi:MAG: hypothetical protein GY832_26640, partial [Chloroflexi bacterium]|nr:hypothetical protein [Chloroflexota bacterium]
MEKWQGWWLTIRTDRRVSPWTIDTFAPIVAIKVCHSAIHSAALASVASGNTSRALGLVWCIGTGLYRFGRGNRRLPPHRIPRTPAAGTTPEERVAVIEKASKEELTADQTHCVAEAVAAVVSLMVLTFQVQSHIFSSEAVCNRRFGPGYAICEVKVEGCKPSRSQKLVPLTPNVPHPALHRPRPKGNKPMHSLARPGGDGEGADWGTAAER